MYKEILPHQLLEDYIACYWYYENFEGLVEVYPDACFDLVIDFLTPDNKMILTGIWDKKITVDVKRDVTTLGIRFKSTAISQFFTCTIKDLLNTTVAFDKSLLKEVSATDFSWCYNTQSIEELLGFFDFYFCELIHGMPNTSLVKPIENKSIQAYAQEISISDRQLRRIYQNNLGLSPKQYSKILSFSKARAALTSNTQMSLTEIATFSGYFDQSHFIREFKKYAGITPTQYQQVK